MKFGSKIHVVGLLSDGGVHSTIEHFKQVIGYFAKQNFPNDLLIHAFTDGRDTPTNVALNYFTDMEKYCTEVGLGKIATFVGRYYGMDRNQKFYKKDENGYHFDYAGCLECGTCRALCGNTNSGCLICVRSCLATNLNLYVLSMPVVYFVYSFCCLDSGTRLLA